MGYDRLGPSGSVSNPTQKDPATSLPELQKRTKKTKLILFTLAVLVVAVVCFGIFAGIRAVGSDQHAPKLNRKPTREISQTCSKAQYTNLCIDTLLDFPGALTADENQLIHISFNATLQSFSKALYSSSTISYAQMPPRVRSAYDSCLELLDDSVDALSRALSSIVAASSSDESRSDVTTWLSSAMTNHDTCTEGFDEAGDDGGGGGVKDQVIGAVKDLSEMVSNCLAIFSGNVKDLSGVPVVNHRKLLGEEGTEEFPYWLKRGDREILGTPATEIQADITVSKDGIGAFKTIAEAIKKAPEHSSRRFVIHVKAGKYEEDILKVGRKKTNIMFVGDGKGKTVITGGKSIVDDLTTFHTATFAATGAGFIVRDITFENYAGPGKHQAVALRVGGDHAVIYRCSIIGYQDALYVHSNRQFYRECDIYGTVDFIFGNAAVILQSCNIYARKPMPQQKITITAQNRKDPNQNTGISIHACKLLATADLEASKGSYPTYLGRPWKLYSRVVYMMSDMGDHINPRGWLEWNGPFALDSLYYGEYMNRGPGAGTGQRVKWPGYHIITSTIEASKFTVGQFIGGSSWLPSTGVAFFSGLSQ
ncbi:putative pectinesterase/pectinesterase inhibitor 61 [Raphanus sativus]|uniref:Pectinesterase n=1 Tax=Raphanus sativus TaxID=3726 RepID=A0A6J0LAA1_RAPSA|nr:probable pectinesterase/pectinesterase inhibitor 61 [Raphanus sativus]KAJ4875690.1 putative pectinesterase/pectinesterase inhibitor 61 [Raphanus sativus]